MKKYLKLLPILALLLMVAVGCNSNEKTENAIKETNEGKTITVVDNAGRTVELNYPVETAVVSNRYNSELIRAIGAIDKVIAVDENTAQDREFWSEFDPENTIGKGQTELNYEKIIELEPEVLIIPKNGTYEEAEEKLSPFGIKVLVISGYDTGDFVNQVNNLGAIFGKEEEAKYFIDWYNDIINYIGENIKDEDVRTVYLETLKPYNTTFEGDFFYDMVKFSKGKHIFNEKLEGIEGNEINPESVILENPEVIVKMITPSQALSGTGLYEAPSKEDRTNMIEEIKNRPAWDEIDAVKNNEVYVMSQFGHGGASKLVGASYMAKWIYGDKLPELDPVEIERVWMEEFQGFKFVEGHFYPLPQK